MDTLTHALSGALLSRAVAPSAAAGVTTRDCVALGFLASAFPDVDVVFSLASPLAYLYHHRGVTHSVLMLPLWAFALAWLWSRLRRNPAGMKAYFLVSALSIGIHILGDLITSFGTIIFAPFSRERFQWSTTFIIDLWFSGIIVAGLFASWFVRSSRVPAIAALFVLCGYVSFQWMQQQKAIDAGRNYARAQGLEDYDVSALPRPVSPFNWMVIVRQPDVYHYAFVNLHRAQVPSPDSAAGFIARLDAAYAPVGAARWERVARYGEGEARVLAEQAWQQASFEFFRWFAAFPMLARVDRGNPSTCVWFRDLRFLTPGRDAWPFGYGLCRAEGGAWQPYQLGDAGEKQPLAP